MFTRIRIALGIALTMIVSTFIPVSAKGGFSFININGPGLEDEIRSTNLTLTEDFFAFADFYKNKTTAPENPGVGYEITRYYIEGKREIPFDSLHYYPETGFVYYDGIVGGGWSEYDGKWYLAKPEVKASFESAMALPALPAAQTRTNPLLPVSNSWPAGTLALLVVLAVVFAVAFRFRRLSAHKSASTAVEQ